MLNKELKLQTSTDINATASQVWDTLVNPEKIKTYLFGTDAISDWEKGSELVFTGEYEGTKYIDKGVILEIEPEKILKYTYLSSFSNLQDVPENYSVLTFNILEKDGRTELSLDQVGFANEESRDHSAQNWNMILKEMKKLSERSS